MLDGLWHYLRERTPGQLLRGAVDVSFVYYMAYRALLVLRGTRAMQVGIGLCAVFVLYIVAQVFQLVTVHTVVSALVQSIVLVIVVVFQSDIRRGLMRVGSRAFLFSGRAQESEVIDEVVQAATELARHRVGAIITFEQDANLDEFVGANKGTNLDALVTSELLVSLFVPEGMNKLHDGAVILRNLRVAKAGVFFPMPDAKQIDQSFGSRHRAALGITEETDAVVVVVSEERGTISFCFNGNIASNLDGPKLRTMLEAIFAPKGRKKRPEPAQKRAAETPDAPPSSLPSEISGAAPLRISVAQADEPGARSRRAPRVSLPEADARQPLRPRPLGEAETTGRLPRVATLRSGNTPYADGTPGAQAPELTPAPGEEPGASDDSPTSDEPERSPS